jgi:hypothetical protein
MRLAQFEEKTAKTPLRPEQPGKMLNQFCIPANALLEWDDGQSIHIREGSLLAEVIAQQHQESVDSEQRLLKAVYQRFHATPPSIVNYKDEGMVHHSGYWLLNQSSPSLFPILHYKDWERNAALLAHKHVAYRGRFNRDNMPVEAADEPLSLLFQRYLERNDAAINQAISELAEGNVYYAVLFIIDDTNYYYRTID